MSLRFRKLNCLFVILLFFACVFSDDTLTLIFQQKKKTTQIYALIENVSKMKRKIGQKKENKRKVLNGFEEIEMTHREKKRKLADAKRLFYGKQFR